MSDLLRAVHFYDCQIVATYRIDGAPAADAGGPSMMHGDMD